MTQAEVYFQTKSYLRGYSWVMMMTAVTIAMISIRSMMGRSLVGWKMMRRRWWWRVSRGCWWKLRVSGRLRRQRGRRRRKPTTIVAATSTKWCTWCFQRRFERRKHVQMMSWWPMRGILWRCCAQRIIMVTLVRTVCSIPTSRYIARSSFGICRKII